MKKGGEIGPLPSFLEVVVKIEELNHEFGMHHQGKITFNSLTDDSLIFEASVKHYGPTFSPDDPHGFYLIVHEEEAAGAYLWFAEFDKELLNATFNFIKSYRGG